MSNFDYPLITIQILNWNRAIETQRAIRSAYAQSYPNFEVVLVDNGSTDDSVAISRQNYPQLKIVELDTNYGCPEGRNKGIEYCSGKYIFYLDNDGILHREALLNAYNCMVSKSNIGVITGVVYDFNCHLEVDENIKPHSILNYEHNNFQGGICMHDVDIYKVIGNYPSHFIYGGEELFLTLKLFDTKYKIIKDETVILWHKKSEFARNYSVEQLRAYFNKLYTYVCLLPRLDSILFVLYFLFVYPYHAFRQKIFYKFIVKFKIDFYKTLNLAIKNREPISKGAYRKFKDFKNGN